MENLEKSDLSNNFIVLQFVARYIRKMFDHCFKFRLKQSSISGLYNNNMTLIYTNDVIEIKIILFSTFIAEITFIDIQKKIKWVKYRAYYQFLWKNDIDKCKDKVELLDFINKKVKDNIYNDNEVETMNGMIKCFYEYCKTGHNIEIEKDIKETEKRIKEIQKLCI